MLTCPLINKIINSLKVLTSFYPFGNEIKYNYCPLNRWISELKRWISKIVNTKRLLLCGSAQREIIFKGLTIVDIHRFYGDTIVLLNELTVEGIFNHWKCITLVKNTNTIFKNNVSLNFSYVHHRKNLFENIDGP